MRKIFPFFALFSLPALGVGVGLAFASAALDNARAQAPAAPAPAKPNHDNLSAHISKFEARRIRHACRDRANERSLKGAERDAYLTKCFFGRASHRGLRRECARYGEAKGLDKASLREFTRECVKERLRQKTDG